MVRTFRVDAEGARSPSRRGELGAGIPQRGERLTGGAAAVAHTAGVWARAVLGRKLGRPDSDPKEAMPRLTRVLLLAAALIAITAAPSEAHKLTIKHAEKRAAKMVPDIVMDMVEPFGFQPEEFGWGTHERDTKHRVVLELIVVDWGDECASMDENEEVPASGRRRLAACSSRSGSRAIPMTRRRGGPPSTAAIATVARVASWRCQIGSRSASHSRAAAAAADTAIADQVAP